MNEIDRYSIICKKKGSNDTATMKNSCSPKLFNNRRKWAQHNTEWKKQHL